MAIINSISSTVNTDANSQSAQSAQGLEEDLNRFLTLLTTQLQHQDPLDPMDATEFTSQLVQFASVEQQIFQNSNLEKLLKLEETTKLASLVDFIDTQVEVEGKGMVVENGKAKFTYNVPSGVVNNTVVVTNAEGLQVLTFDGQTDAGIHVFEWDGVGNNGQPVQDGLYTVQVNAQDTTGKLVEVYQTSFGRVTGAGVVNGETTLFLGPLRVSQDTVLSVEEVPEPAPAS
ncbi:MAG: flagellar hook assembly protein FlgD [Rhodospirillaceae bacterium]